MLDFIKRKYLFSFYEDNAGNLIIKNLAVKIRTDTCFVMKEPTKHDVCSTIMCLSHPIDFPKTLITLREQNEDVVGRQALAKILNLTYETELTFSKTNKKHVARICRFVRGGATKTTYAFYDCVISGDWRTRE